MKLDERTTECCIFKGGSLESASWECDARLPRVAMSCFVEDVVSDSRPSDGRTDKDNTHANSMSSSSSYSIPSRPRRNRKSPGSSLLPCIFNNHPLSHSLNLSVFMHTYTQLFVRSFVSNILHSVPVNSFGLSLSKILHLAHVILSHLCLDNSAFLSIRFFALF